MKGTQHIDSPTPPEPNYRNGSTTAREVELISRIAQGDRKAFEELYGLYHRRLARFLTRLTKRYDVAVVLPQPEDKEQVLERIRKGIQDYFTPEDLVMFEPGQVEVNKRDIAATDAAGAPGHSGAAHPVAATPVAFPPAAKVTAHTEALQERVPVFIQHIGNWHEYYAFAYSVAQVVSASSPFCPSIFIIKLLAGK